MPVDVVIPALGESIQEGVIARWSRPDGARVARDEALLDLETDKANVQISAEREGVLRILKPEGTTVQVGEVVARIEEASAEAPASEAAAPAESARPAPSTGNGGAPPEPPPLGPAARKLVTQHQLDPSGIPATGRGGRLTQGDVLAHLQIVPGGAPAAAPPRPSAAPARPRPAAPEDEEERVPMTRFRQRIAERLVEAQHSAAILTTFNEVDMSTVLEWRNRHKARFAEVHGASLGFVSFFARACIGALRDLPVVNARIDGSDIVYKKHVHLGVAVSTERGLVVPVVRHADRMSFAELEREIDRLARAAREGRLGIDDLSGGTFTISNGGVFGSLLSTPILNPPQSAILGMHKIEKRPVVVNDEIAIRPMMYLALSYDHRLIDGEQAVTFLVRVKERIEDPTRLVFDL